MMISEAWRLGRMAVAAAAMMAVSLCAGTGLTQEEDSEQTLLVVHRPNLVVSDLDRALKIYRDILGFKVNVILPLKKDSYTYDMYHIDPAAQLRLAFLSAGEKQFGALALTEVKGVDLPQISKAPYQASVIVEVSGLTDIVARLKAEGLEMGEPRDLDMPPRTDFAFTDYDGHRIVLFQTR